MGKLKRGIVEVYRGKSPYVQYSALGLVARASGHGMKCCIIQFRRNEITSALESLDFVENKLFSVQSREEAESALAHAEKALSGECYDIVVLDSVLDLGEEVLQAKVLENLIRKRPFSVELVLTGDSLPKAIYTLVDLITTVEKW